MILIELEFELINKERAELYREAIARIAGAGIAPRGGGDARITDNPEHTGGIPTLLEFAGSFPLAADSTSRVMPAHRLRFLPEVVPMKQALEAGKLGDPGLIRTHHWITGDQKWRTYVFGHLDLAIWLFGAHPEVIEAQKHHHLCQLHLGFPGDRMALLDVATRHLAGAYFSMHLVGSDGAVYADDHRNTHLHFAGKSTGVRAIIHTQNEILATQGLVAEFVAGIAEDREWSVTKQDAFDASKAMDTAMASIGLAST